MSLTAHRVATIGLSLFGIADTVFGLRRRFGAGKAGPRQPPTLLP